MRNSSLHFFFITTCHTRLRHVFRILGHRSFQHRQLSHGDQQNMWAGWSYHERPQETTIASSWHIPMDQATSLQRHRSLCVALRHRDPHIPRPGIRVRLPRDHREDADLVCNEKLHQGTAQPDTLHNIAQSRILYSVTSCNDLMISRRESSTSSNRSLWTNLALEDVPTLCQERES